MTAHCPVDGAPLQMSAPGTRPVAYCRECLGCWIDGNTLRGMLSSDRVGAQYVGNDPAAAAWPHGLELDRRRKYPAQEPADDQQRPRVETHQHMTKIRNLFMRPL